MQEHPTSILKALGHNFHAAAWIPDYSVDLFLSLQNLSLGHYSIANEVCVCHRQWRDTAYAHGTEGKVRSAFNRWQWPLKQT